ncbi:2909_t:CDS:2 [Diversispora eburnea]|uniref:2909_t:CDS:1 n=1 Tax=Diversispora eburnea TaxID=1213867 RepID=A0A9N9EYJ0_9GLOM|nr:2909_t:CDS:2 [Diversispora eburnea]
MSNNNLLRFDTSFSFSTPSSSRASSVIPDEEYEDVPSSISTPSSSSAGSVIPYEEPTNTDFHRPTKTNGPKLTHPTVMINKTAKTGQISLAKNRRRSQNRYAPYLNSQLGERGRVVNNEMSEALSSRYTKEVGEKFLGTPVSIRDRKDLRKYNTRVCFLDGLHQHSKNKKKPPCRNSKYDDYKFLRSTINPGPYEDCEWEEYKWKPFSNPKFSPNKLLQVRRDELNKLQRERGILVLPPTFLMDDDYSSDIMDDYSPNIMDDY